MHQPEFPTHRFILGDRLIRYLNQLDATVACPHDGLTARVAFPTFPVEPRVVVRDVGVDVNPPDRGASRGVLTKIRASVAGL
jgi:hypothetical protein